MSYTDNKITTAMLDGKGVVGLPNTPELSTTDMQKKFDELALDVIIPSYNDLCDTLETTSETTEGEIDEINSSIETLESTTETLTSAVSTINGEIETINGDIETIEGSITTLNGSVATNTSNIATANSNIAEINETLPTKVDKTNPVASGKFAMNVADGATLGDYSFSEGYHCEAKGNYSHAEGNGNTASGESSHAEGYNNKVSQYSAHVEGRDNKVQGYADYSHVEGKGNTANGECSHIEGNNNTTSNGAHYAHVEGMSNTASADFTHAEGCGNTASGGKTHAEGYETTAQGVCSHSEGEGTYAVGHHQHVQGKWNVKDTESKYVDIIGGGTSSSNRKNLETLDWSGNLWVSGTVTDGSGHVLGDVPTKVSELTNDSGFVSSYDECADKPSINNVTLAGNKSLTDLGIASATDINPLVKDISFQQSSGQLAITKKNGVRVLVDLGTKNMPISIYTNADGDLEIFTASGYAYTVDLGMDSKVDKYYHSNELSENLTDSASGAINSMLIYGRSEQTQLSGKNLYDESTKVPRVLGDDGSLNVASDSYTSDYIQVTSGQYTLSFTRDDTGCYVRVIGFDSSKNLISSPLIYKNTDLKVGFKTNLFTVPSGVAFIRFCYPKASTNVMLEKGNSATSYEPYCGGIPSPSPSYPQTIHSVVEPSVDVSTDNVFDEQMEVGSINLTNGATETDANRLRSKNYISVDENSNYYITVGEFAICFYDSNKAYISSQNWTRNNLFTTPSNAKYVKFKLTSAYGLTYKNDIAIIKGTSGNYVPYAHQSATLSDITLNAIPVSSGGNVTINGQQYIADYVDIEKKKIVRLVERFEFDKDSDWERASSAWDSYSGMFGVYLGKSGYSTYNDHITSNFRKQNSVSSLSYNRSVIYANTFYCRVTFCETVADFKTWLEDKKIIVNVVAPTQTEESLTDAQVADFLALKTYDNTTNVIVSSDDINGATQFKYCYSMEARVKALEDRLNELINALA